MSKRALEHEDGSSSVSQENKKRRTKGNESSDQNRQELTKEQRKELKRQRKAKRAEEVVLSLDGVENPGANGDAHGDKANGTDSKAQRKAEKLARKEAKLLKKQAKHNVESKNTVHNHGADPTTATITESDEKVVAKAVDSPLKRHNSAAYIEDSALAALPQSDIDAFLSKHMISITDPSNSSVLRPIISFSHLSFADDAEKAPFKTFTSPTPIQAISWPFLLSGRDVIGVAETGSGKTLAFAVPCIRRIKSSANGKTPKGVKAVIVSPTRELAIQIYEQIIKLAQPAGLGAVCVYGGVQKDEQRKALKSASIVVGTPGRLNDLIDEGSADLSRVEYLVLDEADRMLDKGFEDAIKRIINSIPPKSSRQTLMFTATWPQSVRELAGTFMSDPVRINIGDNPTGDLRANTRITQTVEVLDPRGKEFRLLQLLKEYQSGKNKDDRILVFCLYKKEATRIENFIRSKGFRVAGIHGDLSQQQRMTSLDAFKSGNVPLLVATDVAARGLDIPAVKMVINVTFPLTVEDYVHRIGRTGRAGKNGLAVTLFTEHDKAQSGALINVMKAAGQPVPDALLKFGTTVKKKGHEAYGAFYRDVEDSKPATKIRFD